MKMLDLFTGIGGFSLAAHWMGWETIAFVEWNPFCQKVLKKNFPNVPVYGDIKQFDGTKYNRTIDLICGGFPCQPFSTAGNRKGKNDDRYLWHEMLRVIKEVKPTWIVGENVAGLLTMENGSILDGILTDLENEGYQTQTFIIPACAVQAPHRRDRVWIIAYSNECASRRNAGKLPRTNGQSRVQKRQSIQPPCQPDNDVANPNSQRSEWTECAISGFNQFDWTTHWYEVATKLCGTHDGISARLDKNRAKRLKALGNAVVPQVVFEIFKAIEQIEI